MRSLVIYESMFGNTRTIATAIATGLAAFGDARAVCVTDVGPRGLEGIDLLVLGAPTHGHSLSRSSTRTGAMKQAARPDSSLMLESGATGPGMREWLASNAAPWSDAIAVFDTRAPIPRLLAGSAAVAIARSVRRNGGRLVAKPKSFFVVKPTVLRSGELGRASAWGAHLGDLVGSGPSSTTATQPAAEE